MNRLNLKRFNLSSQVSFNLRPVAFTLPVKATLPTPTVSKSVATQLSFQFVFQSLVLSLLMLAPIAQAQAKKRKIVAVVFDSKPAHASQAPIEKFTGTRSVRPIDRFSDGVTEDELIDSLEPAPVVKVPVHKSEGTPKKEASVTKETLLESDRDPASVVQSTTQPKKSSKKVKKQTEDELLAEYF